MKLSPTLPTINEVMALLLPQYARVYLVFNQPLPKQTKAELARAQKARSTNVALAPRSAIEQSIS
jgi:hypothetical protein